MAVEIPVLTQQLQAFCLSHYGQDASVHQVEAMPGHAGLSFGFTVVYEKDGQAKNESLVMRLPPKGVRQRRTGCLSLRYVGPETTYAGSRSRI